MPRMGWMQLRRWLSFLPAAFVLYILLHYLVYQPNMQEAHNSYLGGSSRLVKLSVSDVSSQELSTVLPPSRQNLTKTNVASLTTITEQQQQDNYVVKDNLILPAEVYARSLSDAVGQLSDAKIAAYEQEVIPEDSTSFDNPNWRVISNSEVIVGPETPAVFNEIPAEQNYDLKPIDNYLAQVNGGNTFQELATTNFVIEGQNSPEENVLVDISSVPVRRRTISMSPVSNPSLMIEEAKSLIDSSASDKGRKTEIFESRGAEASAHHESIIIPRELLGREEKIFSRKEENVSSASVSHLFASKSKTVAASEATVPQKTSNVSSVVNKDSAKKDSSVPPAKLVVVSEAPSKSAKHQNVSKESRGTIKSSSAKVVKAKGAAIQPRQAVVKLSPKHAISALKGKHIIRDNYEFGFTTPHEEICLNNGRDLRVLILVTTAPSHEKHRNAVRQTWGHFALRRDVAIAFVVGRTERADVQTLIDKENERYGDVIEANFVDHYSNLTLKTVAMFEWASTYCSEAAFVLKTDDDMFINVPLLLAFISAKKNEKQVMYGRLAKGWKPIRNAKSKYFIPNETYSRTRYPDFLTGPAYLFTSDVVEQIYKRALVTTFFILEDVFLTGFIGESLGIRRIGDSHFRNEKISLKDTCKLMQSISIHMVKYEEQFDIYKRTLDGKTKCKTR